MSTSLDECEAACINAARVRSHCPLCGAVAHGAITTGDAREYFRCAGCALVFLHPAQRLSAADEKARYELHRNDPADADYVAFLRRLADPIAARLQPGARGLDFGCGPAPVLSQLLTGSGLPCAAYDPFFHPNESLLRERYDYVVCSEVVEHAHDAAAMFATLHSLLRPGGVLGVMTRFYPECDAFGDWWYRRDPTHVCFYNEASMRWITTRHASTVDFPCANIAIFTMLD